MSTPHASAESQDSNPAQFVKRVDRHSGDEIPGPIEPDELLIHAYRDRHPLEVTAQFLASRAVQWTGSEMFARQGLRVINTVGTLVAQAVGTAVGSPDLERQAKKFLGVVDRDSSLLIHADVLNGQAGQRLGKNLLRHPISHSNPKSR